MAEDCMEIILIEKLLLLLKFINWQLVNGLRFVLDLVKMEIDAMYDDLHLEIEIEVDLNLRLIPIIYYL